MTESPLARFQPKIALLSGTPDNARLEVLLAPFTLGSELVDTSIRLDHIALPSLVLADLVGKSLNFPINPAPGCIDGLIYLAKAHHPVDVTAMSFHVAREGGMSVVLKGCIDFEREGEKAWGRMPFAFGVRLASCAV